MYAGPAGCRFTVYLSRRTHTFRIVNAGGKDFAHTSTASQQPPCRLQKVDRSFLSTIIITFLCAQIPLSSLINMMKLLALWLPPELVILPPTSVDISTTISASISYLCLWTRLSQALRLMFMAEGCLDGANAADSRARGGWARRRGRYCLLWKSMGWSFWWRLLDSRPHRTGIP